MANRKGCQVQGGARPSRNRQTCVGFFQGLNERAHVSGSTSRISSSSSVSPVVKDMGSKKKRYDFPAFSHFVTSTSDNVSTARGVSSERGSALTALNSPNIHKEKIKEVPSPRAHACEKMETPVRRIVSVEEVDDEDDQVSKDKQKLD